MVRRSRLALKNLLLRLPSSYSVVELEKRNRIEQQFRYTCNPFCSCFHSTHQKCTKQGTKRTDVTY